MGFCHGFVSVRSDMKFDGIIIPNSSRTQIVKVVNLFKLTNQFFNFSFRFFRE